MENDSLKKMKFSDEKKKTKKKAPQRPSIVSNYSFVSLSEVTEGSLQVWRTLPEKIRQDPSLASFRQEHERLHGEFFAHFHYLLRHNLSTHALIFSFYPDKIYNFDSIGNHLRH